MSLRINNNMMSANSARNLTTHYAELNIATKRLSTGLRINSASDDAAGLAIRELQRVEIAALKQGMRNANDAISLVQTADGALQIIDDILIRMKELAEQAATGTYSSIQRGMIDSEFKTMAAEINRIASSTEFNGIKLLNGNLSGEHNGNALTSTGSLLVHFGTQNDSAQDYYNINIGGATISDLFASDAVSSDFILIPTFGDHEGQNILALPNGNMLVLSNIHTDRSIDMFEYDKDGNLLHTGKLATPPANGDAMQPKEAIVLPNGNIAISYYDFDDKINTVTYDKDWNQVGAIVSASAGENLVGREDMAMSVTENTLLSGSKTESNGIFISMGNSDGSASTAPLTLDETDFTDLPAGTISDMTSTTIGNKHFVTIATSTPQKLTGYFVDNDGTVGEAIDLGENNSAQLATVGDQAVISYTRVDPITNTSTSYARVISSSGALGAELAITEPSADKHQGTIDIAVIFDSSGNPTNQIAIGWKDSPIPAESADMTIKVKEFIVQSGNIVSAGKEIIEVASSSQGGGDIGPANIAYLDDGSIVASWQINDGILGDESAISISRAGQCPIDITTQAKAQNMLGCLDNAIVKKDNIRGHLGAMQNRMESTVDNLCIQAERLQISESRISDVDVGIEMTRFTRTQILAQSSTAMLAQANSLPELGMQLIQG